jgi:hypothetical protein
MSRDRNPDEIVERLAQKSGVVKPSNGPIKRGRGGKVSIMSWHDPAVRQQLKILAAETDKTEQKLIGEALNLLFAKYGKPQIA